MLNSTGTAKPAGDASAGPSIVREDVLRVAGTFELELGGQLKDIDIAWRLVGGPGPIVAALGGISAGRYVTGDDPKGWWSEVVGPGKALDTNRFRVLGLDFLGGSGKTTGPRSGQRDFPSISVYDQVRVLTLLLDHLGIERLDAIIGASYGAMVALAFAERVPDRIAKIVAISGADRAHPMSTAWRSIQRAIVRYSLANQDGAGGLRLARALAMATYRSPQEFEARFGGAPERVAGRYEFPVERYLLARGDAYAASYLPEAFVCLSESIDLHQVDPRRIRVPTILVAVREDQLVPLHSMQALRARLAGPAKLIELSSEYGHDAFLKEADALAEIFEAELGEGGA